MESFKEKWKSYPTWKKCLQVLWLPFGIVLALLMLPFIVAKHVVNFRKNKEKRDFERNRDYVLELARILTKK